MVSMTELLPKTFRAFRPVYRYKFSNGSFHSQKLLDVKLWKQQGVVYARVCDGKVVYIGKCESTLGHRIMAHLRIFPILPRAQKYREFVKGKTVTIFAYKPKPIRLLGLDIPVHVSVEAALIKKFKPPFVMRA
jgi:hypothetical protein